MNIVEVESSYKVSDFVWIVNDELEFLKGLLIIILMHMQYHSQAWKSQFKPFSKLQTRRPRKNEIYIKRNECRQGEEKKKKIKILKYISIYLAFTIKNNPQNKNKEFEIQALQIDNIAISEWQVKSEILFNIIFCKNLET